MVVKRTCSFCAGEIEPGTGTMYIKRDGAVFHFCSSSCRKQQLHLGRVGHRLKWTRAHALRRQTEQSSAAGKAAAELKAKAAATAAPAKKPASPKEPTTAPTSRAKDAEPRSEATPATETAKPEDPTSKDDAATTAGDAKKPRAKKPKEPATPA